MKLLLLSLLVCVACSTGAKVPSVCQRNLKDCTEAYGDSKDALCRMKGPEHCSKEDWNLLCKSDLNLCKENWGMQP
jgi:hypothetical protein